MGVLYHSEDELSILFSDNLGEIATVHGEIKSLHEAGEGDRRGVVTYHGELHAPIVPHSQGIASTNTRKHDEITPLFASTYGAARRAAL
jgi:hypothetical protein